MIMTVELETKLICITSKPQYIFDRKVNYFLIMPISLLAKVFQELGHLT